MQVHILFDESSQSKLLNKRSLIIASFCSKNDFSVIVIDVIKGSTLLFENDKILIVDDSDRKFSSIFILGKSIYMIHIHGK